jgi:uncharacterized membrane protein HdeD (DUF308 family)
MAPMMAGMAVSVTVGILILVAGIARTMYAFKADSFGQGILKFLFGGLMILVGLTMLTRPLTGLASLTLVLIVFFLMDGIFEIVAAFKVKPEKGWGWLLFGGIVSAALAIMIWRQWPVSGAWAIGILLGIRMMFAGFSMIALGADPRSAGPDFRKARPGGGPDGITQASQIERLRERFTLP